MKPITSFAAFAVGCSALARIIALAPVALAGALLGTMAATLALLGLLERRRWRRISVQYPPVEPGPEPEFCNALHELAGGISIRCNRLKHDATEPHFGDTGSLEWR
jgi:hypothetical protein